jgi:hypothetical protein
MKRIDDLEEGGGTIEVPDTPSEPADKLVVEVGITKPTADEQLTGSAQGVTVVVEGTARIAQGTGSIEKVEVEVGGGGFQPAQSTGSGWATWKLPVLVTSAGTVQVKARAVANGQTFPERAVTITTHLNPDATDPSDTTPPTVAIVAPRAGTALVLSGGSVEVSIAGTASDGGAGVKEVTLSVDGRPVPATAVNDTWANWSARAQLLGTGRHTIAATATDKNGLKSTARVELVTSTEPLTAPVVERLLLVEKLRLTTFRREYGVGKPIKVISLAPRERTTLAVKTFRRTSETATEASSILDSSTREAQEEFERQLLTEQTNKRTAEESVDWNVGGQAAADWGWGSATMNASASGSTNGSREELAKSVVNAVQKQAAKAMAKREVEIKTSREMKTEESEEFSSESLIENPNSSRTLNLIFSEVNQRFLSILHLVDIRLAYVRGDLVTDETGEYVSYSYREVTLSQLDGLLRQVIVPERRDDVRARILEALAYVFDCY